MKQQNEKLNEELKTYFLKIQETKNSRELEKYFSKIKPLLMIHKFKDPSGVLTYDDFLSIAMQAFWKAANKYKEEISDNTIFWVIKLVRQKISYEIKNTNKKSKDIINSHMNPDLDIYNLGIPENHTNGYLKVNEEHLKEIFELHERIFVISQKAAHTFQLRLVFPYIDRTSISIILKLKRRTGVSKLVKIIRAISKNELDKEILESLE